MTKKISILSLQPLSPRLSEFILSSSDRIELVQTDLKNSADYWYDADILLAWGQMDIDPYLPSAKQLKWIQTLSAGVDQILTPSVIQKEIIVTNTRGIHGIPISEYIFSTLLSYKRKLNVLKKQQSISSWDRVVGDEIYSKTIGIIGLGSIGREIAKRAKAFGMVVLASKATQSEELFIDELYLSNEIETLLPKCDIVVLALPLTEQTHHLFNSEKFELMKKNVCFINISRGEVVVEKDLIKALVNGKIEHAILDVFEKEPLPIDSPFWQLENVTLTPHISALTPYYMERAIQLFSTNIERYLTEKPLSNIINLQKGY